MFKTIFIIVTLALIMALFELPPLIKKARISEAIIYSIMLITGSILSVFALQGTQIPSPMKVPEVLYKPLYEWLQQILKIKGG